MTQLKIALLNPDTIVPTYAHDGDSGLDLYAPEEVVLEPGKPTTVDTGVAIELAPGFEAQVRPRSGLLKRGVTGGFGTVDNGYRGSIGVVLTWSYHPAMQPYDRLTLARGSRIAQLVVAPVARCSVEVVPASALTQTDRGNDGFGSTGA